MLLDRAGAGVRVRAAVAGFLMIGAGAASAQSPAEFYKGKTVTLAVGAAIGGGIDINGRIVAKHMGRHLPGNPAIVVQNVPGASGLALANSLSATAPRDGAYMAALNRFNIFHKLLVENSSATFDSLALTYLGSPDKIWSVAYVWHTSRIKRAEDLFTQECVVGAASEGSAHMHPHMLNKFAGTKFKIVTGYKGGADVDLAVERGEVEGRASTAPVNLLEKNWIADKKVTLLFWNGLEKHPKWANLPLALDLVKKPEDRKLMEVYYSPDEIGYPYVAPPAVPADRLAALRKAFADTMADKAFIDDMTKQKLEVNYVSAERITKIVADVFAAPEAIVRRLREAQKTN